MADSADIPPPGSLLLRDAVERFGDASLSAAYKSAVEELNEARASMPVIYKESWMTREMEPTNEETPKVRQLAAAQEEAEDAFIKSLWVRLLSGEVLGFGRKNEPTAPYQKIPPDSWQYLGPTDWDSSVVGEPKKNGIKFYSVRLCEARPRVDWSLGTSLNHAAAVLCPLAVATYNAWNPGDQSDSRSLAWAEIVKTLEIEIARHGLTLQFLDPPDSPSGAWNDVSPDALTHLGLSGIWINSFWAALSACLLGRAGGPSGDRRLDGLLQPPAPSRRAWRRDAGRCISRKAVGFRTGLTPGPPPDSPGGVTSVISTLIGRPGL